ncbi:MAG: hypothetical protein UT17_C0007G0025 [Candidatus Woesebacteria bacterium GW2011_GWB1_39_10]|uniref:Uncharacterized protein n=1 Tax=Candidatus Woesebacteria bacterium GW2011_GWB1_39_10 TaxID=1618572 RepID=A0A0G0P062_9BACT|nr:MAG: hypothetical protein UT17_C0007G0025 [Candidatus Woesebacteria bacterium GW2011_GWB1_39_10]
MRSRIQKILATNTFRQSVITVVSTFGTAGLGAVFYLLLARTIGTREFGLFSVSVSILTLAVSFADVGMGQGLVKFVAENSRNNAYWPFAKIAIQTKLVIGLFICLALWIFARPIASVVLHQPEITYLLPAVGLGILSILLFSLSVYTFQGLQKFYVWGGIQVGANLFRLILFALLFLVLKINSFWGLILFAAAPLSGFILSLIWLPVIKILKSKVTKEQIHNFWNFNKWTAAFGIAGSLSSRIDVLLTARFLTLSDTGIYALAGTMVAFLPQFSSALGAVTAPKFASFTDSTHSGRYLFKAGLFSLGTSLMVAIVMIPTALVVLWFTGKDFSTAFTPFLILLASLTLFTSLNPLRDSILYFYKQPQFFFWVNLIQAGVLVVSSFILIPKFGVTGTALAVLISHIVYAVINVWKYEDCRARSG